MIWKDPWEVTYLLLHSSFMLCHDTLALGSGCPTMWGGGWKYHHGGIILGDLPHAHAIKIIGVVPLHDNNSPCPVSRRPLTSAMVTSMISALHLLFAELCLNRWSTLMVKDMTKVAWLWWNPSISTPHIWGRGKDKNYGVNLPRSVVRKLSLLMPSHVDHLNCHPFPCP